MSDFGMPSVAAGFGPRAAFVVRRLLTDFPVLKDFHAAAVVGNLGGESGLLAVQEKHPLAGLGGFGWEQATGTRRSAFYAYAAAHGLSVKDDEANYGFLVSELQTTEKVALDDLVQQDNLNSATLSFCVKFERPADPYGTLPNRVKWAKRALDAYHANADTAYTPDPDNSADALNGQELAQIKADQATNPAPADGSQPVVRATVHPAVTLTSSVGIGAAVVGLAYNHGLITQDDVPYALTLLSFAWAIMLHRFSWLGAITAGGSK